MKKVNSKSLLIVTRYNCDINDIINKYYQNYRIVWLQLWPSTVTDIIMSRYPAISIYNSTDFISNENHYRNAKEASHISKNWWSLLGLSDHENELNIDGLKICNIYETKILKSLSTVLYCISTITNAVKKLSINKTIIVEPSVNHAKPNGVLTNYNIYEIFKDAELEDTVFMVDTAFPIDMEFTKYIIQHRINSIMYKLATFSPLDIIKYFNVNKNKMTSNSIVISNSKRWLEQFIINIPKRYSITILSDNVSNLNKNFSRPATGYNISNYYFNEINLKKYFDVLINSTISDFYSLKNEYAHLSKLLRVNKPLVYITIDISNANEFVKLWAMKNAKVKVVLAQEAACSLDYSLSLSLNHHFKPQLIKIERWVIGKHIIENYFKKNNVIETGSMGISMNKIKVPKSHKKQLLLIMSDPLMNSSAGQMHEDIFEIIYFIKQVVKALAVFKHHTLVIKPHPGDLKNISLYKSLFNKNDRVYFETKNVYKLIGESQIVILYQSSVLIESLFYGKNVIFYNYLGRPSYSSAVYDSLNHKPELGAAVIEVKSQEQLIKAIKKLVNINSNHCSPGLKYVLKNAEPNYDVVQEVQNVLKTLD